MKSIRLSDHALRYASKRGFTVDEVVDTIRTTPWQSAELGRLEYRKDFRYDHKWNGRIYATKQVRPCLRRRSCGVASGVHGALAALME